MTNFLRRQPAKPWISAALLAMVIGASLCSVNARLLATHRSLRGAPGSQAMSQCSWAPGGWPERCAANNMALLSTKQNNTVRTANYAASASAFLTAGNLYCSQYTTNTKACTWPCLWNNEACVIADELTKTVWDCPDSKARQFFFCPEAPHRTQAWCGTLPECTYTPQPNTSLRACEATFWVNLSPSERLNTMGPMYYVYMARELIGCCQGSNYRYEKQYLCAAAMDQRDQCTMPGCRYDEFTLKCAPTPEQGVKMMFESDPSDPLSAQLQKIAGECDAITTQDACESYKPVDIDTKKMLYYLNQDLDGLNTPVNATMCLPPSMYSPPSPDSRISRLRM